MASGLVTDETINEIQKKILENIHTEFIPTETKNVLFCGASKSGKSTVINVLQNPCYCPKTISLFSETKFTCFQNFSLTNRKNGTTHNFTVNLIDAHGLVETRANREGYFKNKVSDIITGCINLEITYLNLIVLVINSFKFPQTDIESIEMFINSFGGCSIPIILCLTHADSIGEKRRKEIEMELARYKGLAKYFEKDLFKVKWMGCVNYVGRDYTNERQMLSDYYLVAEWRKNFLDEISRVDERVQLDLNKLRMYYW